MGLGHRGEEDGRRQVEEENVGDEGQEAREEEG